MLGKKVMLSAIGTVTVIAGGAAAYWYMGKDAGNQFNPSTIAKIIPEDAFMAAFVSTDPQSWSKLQQFGTVEARQTIDRQLQTLQTEMLQESQVDLKQDLSWANNAMIAVLPPGTNDPDPDLLVVVGIKDKLAALQFAQKLESQPGVKTQEQDYKGVKIKGSTSDGSTIYTTVLNDYLVLSPELPAVERSIDTQQGQPSLATKAGDLLAEDLDSPNSVARFYVTGYAAAMQQMLASSSPMQLPPGMVDQLQQVKSIVGSVGIDDTGVRIKALTNLDPKMAIAYKPASGAVISQFPSNTFALVSGAGIDHYWSQIVQQANTTSEAQLLVGGMRQAAKSYLQLDLDREVFSWMDGEFAVGLMPTKQGALSQVGFGSAMVFDTSNRKQAEATFKKLDQLAKTYSLKVSQRQVKNQPVTEWSVPGQGTLLGHGWLDNDSVFVTIDSSLANVIVNKPSSTLSSSDSFKALTTSLPKQNMGYFYVNVEQIMPLLNQAQLVSQSNQKDPEINAALASIRGVAMTWTQPSQSSNQMELLFSLKSAQQ